MHPDPSAIVNEYKNRGYSEAEMEILLRLVRLEVEVHQLTTGVALYVRRDEFKPVQQLVYGMVGVVLLAFVGALVALVMTR